MDYEFDLRSYTALVTRYWRLIAGLAVAGAVVAALVSRFLLVPTYEAEATIVVAASPYRVSLESRITSATTSRPSGREYGALAESAGLLAQVVEQLDDSLPPQLRSAEAIAELCRVSFGRDTSIIRLGVQYTDPGVAADVANAWATLYVPFVNSIYGASGQDVAELELQVESAAQRLQQHEQAEREFQLRSLANTLSATLEAKRRLLEDGAIAEVQSGLVLEQLTGLKDRLGATGADSHALQSELAAVLIQLKSLAVNGGFFPRVQVALDSSAALSLADGEVRQLVGLITALEADRQVLAAGQESIAGDMTEAQLALQQEQVETQHLGRAKALAEEVYIALLRKLEESRLAQALESGEARIGALAVVPRRPVAPNTPFNVALGALMGLVLGISGALAHNYMAKPGRASEHG
jgi:uncharacterized protein involved in exopolysaccharide biosynthesis